LAALGAASLDLLVAIAYRTDSTADWPDPSGWDRIATAAGNSNRSWVWAKVAAGSDTFSIDRSASAGAVAVNIRRFTGWTGATTASVEATLITDFSGDWNPPSETASWGAADNLFMTFLGRNDLAVSAFPAGYSGDNLSAFNSGVWGDLRSATKNSTLATDDPAMAASGQGNFLQAGTIVVRGSSAGDTTAPSITSTGTGATNGPFAVNVGENSTAVAITLTSDEALGTVTKGGADGALFTLAGSGLTRTLAPTAAFDFESLPHANPFVVTLTFADTATPTPNERTVTVNFTVTNVSEPPLAPTIGAAVAGNAQATVNGTAPVNTGRPAITGYRSTATPGGSTVSGASLPIAHTGLTNGTAYTFTLAAQNADGFGPESAPSNSVTPTAPAPGPTIDTQPTNQTAKVGASATFTVAATSSGGALAYQWRLGGTPISGANSASYTRTGVALGDHGAAFTCAVTDSNGTTVSSAATLTVAVTFAGTVPDFTGTAGSSSSIDLSSYFSGGLSRTFAVLSGSMPTGLTQVGSTAVWTGTLGAAGSGSFVVRATDSATNTDVTNTVNWVIGLTTPGTVTSSVLKNNDGWIFANVSGISCFARNPTTGADVLLKTGLSSNGSGVVSFADAALAQNTDYELRWKVPDPEFPTHGANGWEIVRST
jgi:hypothetical protein